MGFLQKIFPLDLKDSHIALSVLRPLHSADAGASLLGEYFPSLKGFAAYSNAPWAWLAGRLVGIEEIEFTGIAPVEGRSVTDFVDSLISKAYAKVTNSTEISAEKLLLKLLNSDETKTWELNSNFSTQDTQTSIQLKLPLARKKK
jgi:hypothetical protein